MNTKQSIQQHLERQAAEWQAFAPEIREKVTKIEAQQAAAKTRQEAAEIRLLAAETRISQIMQRITALEMAEAARPLNRIKKILTITKE